MHKPFGRLPHMLVTSENLIKLSAAQASAVLYTDDELLPDSCIALAGAA